MSRARESLFDRWLLAALIIGLLMFGGSARIDSLGLAAVRSLAVVAIFLALPHWWDNRAAMPSGNRSLLLLLGAAAALFLLQLVPLPEGVWTALPGRGALAEKMVAAGVPVGWRAFSLTPERTLQGLLDLLVPLAVLLTLSRTSAKSLRQLPLVLIGFIGVTAALGVLQLLAGADTGPYFHAITNRGSAVGFFANRNHHALFLTLYWPLLLWYLHGRPDRAASHAGTLLGVAGGVAIMLAIGATGSRAGLGIGAATFLLSTFLLYRWRDRGVGTLGAARLVTVTTLVAGVTGIAGILVLWLFGDAFFARMDKQDLVSDLRLSFWPVLVDVARTYFPVGGGMGSFEATYKIAEPVDLLRLNYLNHAHNDYLELLIDGGLAALALIALWAMYVLRAVRRILRDPAAAPNDRVGIFVSLAMLAIFAVGSLFDYPLRTPALAAMAMLATALLARRPDLLPAKKPRRTARGFD